MTGDEAGSGCGDSECYLSPSTLISCLMRGHRHRLPGLGGASGGELVGLQRVHDGSAPGCALGVAQAVVARGCGADVDKLGPLPQSGLTVPKARVAP